MRKKIIVFFSLWFLFFEAFSFDFSGVWLLNRWVVSQSNNSQFDFSWGKELVPNNTMDIAIDEKNNEIIIFGIGIFDIKSIEKMSASEYFLIFDFNRGGFDVTYKIELIDEKEFILENLTETTHFVAEGEQSHYYRISGPTEVKKNDKPIYAIYTGNGRKNESLKKGEKIRLIGIDFSANSSDDMNGVEYWYESDNSNYGYVDINSIDIISE